MASDFKDKYLNVRRSFNPEESRPSERRAGVVMFTFERYQNQNMPLMMFSNGDMLRECVGGRVAEVDPRPDK